MTLSGCKLKPVADRFVKVDGDLLISNIDKYDNSYVEIEGTAVHICGVDRKKIKLKTDNGEYIKIIPSKSITEFDKDLYNSVIKISGKATEYRTSGDYIDKARSERLLLCHVDNTPCKDTEWVERQKEEGKDVEISERNTKRLEQKMANSGKDYVSTIIVTAEKIEVLSKPE